MIGVCTDITDRKRLEGEQIKSQKLESLGTLAGGIAHDFNNLLMSIMGNISLARLNQPLESDLGEILAEVEASCAQASNLTHQVINNLVINADQAMPDGGNLDVGAENFELAGKTSLPLKPGKYVILSIRDSGIGILEKYISRIFDPYFTTKQQGSGLGLATVYSIIRNHNGLITVKSEPGKGTTFSTYLPAAAAHSDGRKKTRSSRKDHPRERANTPHGRRGYGPKGHGTDDRTPWLRSNRIRAW